MNPSDNDQDLKIEGHNYDGIEELDNPMPEWWVFTFLGTIVFGVLYWIYYEPLSGPTLDESLQSEMTRIKALQESYVQSGKQEPVAAVAEIELNDKTIARAKGHYMAKCAACHGNELQGLIGPNLVDKYWIYDRGDEKKMYEVIAEGLGDKGMPPWKGIIPAGEIGELVAYIKSRVGESPPNPKAPQGELVE